MHEAIDTSRRRVLAAANNISLADANKWIGQCLVLQRAWLGFAPGTRCRVMCVVDFGEGLLLWLVTDDEHVRDVDQLEMSIVAELFSELPTQLSGKASLYNEMTLAQSVN